MHSVHVAGGDTAFFDDIQECYLAHMPGTQRVTMTDPVDVPDTRWDLGATQDFGRAEVRRWVTTADYTTAAYLALLDTFSNHIALDDGHRRRLYACIAERLESQYGGHVTKAMLTQLCVALRSSGGP